MTVEDALEFFKNITGLYEKLKTLITNNPKDFKGKTDLDYKQAENSLQKVINLIAFHLEKDHSVSVSLIN